MRYFCNGNLLYNFILLGEDSIFFESEPSAIVKEALATFPDFFLGNCPMFKFELRYIPPYERDFRELKRLQGTAAQNAGYREGFCGYIIIDVNEYLEHEKDRYFDISLKFLYDLGDTWRYIFLINNKNRRAARALAGKILSILPCYIEEQVISNISYHKVFLRNTCSMNHLTLSHTAQQFIESCMADDILSREVISNTIPDLGVFCYPQQNIGINHVLDYFDSSPLILQYTLSEAQWETLLLKVQSQRKKEVIRCEAI